MLLISMQVNKRIQSTTKNKNIFRKRKFESTETAGRKENISHTESKKKYLN